jgi:hypothetical protein
MLHLNASTTYWVSLTADSVMVYHNQGSQTTTKLPQNDYDQDKDRRVAMIMIHDGNTHHLDHNHPGKIHSFLAFLVRSVQGIPR